MHVLYIFNTSNLDLSIKQIFTGTFDNTQTVSGNNLVYYDAINFSMQ